MKTKTGIYVSSINGNKDELTNFMCSLGFKQYQPQGKLVPENAIIFLSTYDNTDEFVVLKSKLQTKFNFPASRIFEFYVKSIYVPVAKDTGEEILTLL